LHRFFIPPPKRYCIVDAASGEVSKVMDELDVKCVDELDAKCVGEPVAVRERNIDSRYRFRDWAIAIELGSCSKSQERSTSEQRQFQERSVETVVIDFDALLKSQGVVGKCVTKDVDKDARTKGDRVG
jgi:hypothetical protein